jgi:hypothetical protein
MESEGSRKKASEIQALSLSMYFFKRTQCSGAIPKTPSQIDSS